MNRDSSSKKRGTSDYYYQPGEPPQTFRDEIWQLSRRLVMFNVRYHLSIFPRDLVRKWWEVLGGLPYLTSKLAFERYKAGEQPRRKLYKGPPHWPKLRLLKFEPA